MAITGTSDVSRLNVTGPGASARSQYQIAPLDPMNMPRSSYTLDTDPYHQMADIVSRSRNQANLRYALATEAQPAEQAPMQRQAAYAPQQRYDSAPQQAEALRTPRPTMFKKFVIAPGGSWSGWAPAEAWEPGAVAAGDLPEGATPYHIPQNSQIGAPMGASRASLDAPGSNALTAGIQTPGTVSQGYATGPGVTSGNPYATGAGDAASQDYDAAVAAAKKKAAMAREMFGPYGMR